MEIGAVIMENNMEVLQKVKNRITIKNDSVEWSSPWKKKISEATKH